MLGDHLNAADYDKLYGAKQVARSALALRSLVMAVVLALGLIYAVVLLVLSLEKHSPISMPVSANERVLAHPLGTTWVEQSGNDSRGKQIRPRRYYTFAGDLTERK